MPKLSVGAAVVVVAVDTAPNNEGAAVEVVVGPNWSPLAAVVAAAPPNVGKPALVAAGAPKESVVVAMDMR